LRKASKLYKAVDEEQRDVIVNEMQVQLRRPSGSEHR